MSYYKELTEYTYHGGMFYRPDTRNVGWLDVGHEFATDRPTEHVLDRIWSLCKVSVAQMRGVHQCEFCNDIHACDAERHGETLLLGTSEIRVFGDNGVIYAAPTLIYHYMLRHHYSPPGEFLRALDAGLIPPEQAYFDRLRELDLEWNKTSPGGGKIMRL